MVEKRIAMIPDRSYTAFSGLPRRPVSVLSEPWEKPQVKSVSVARMGGFLDEIFKAKEEFEKNVGRSPRVIRMRYVTYLKLKREDGYVPNTTSVFGVPIEIDRMIGIDSFVFS